MIDINLILPLIDNQIIMNVLFLTTDILIIISLILIIQRLKAIEG